MKRKPDRDDKEELLKKEEEYLLFLKKRLDSDNYRNGVDIEEYEKTKKKYERCKLKLKFMREDLR